MLSVLVLVLAIASYSQIAASPKDRNDYNLNNKLKPHSGGRKLSLDRYYTYEEIVEYIESLAQRYPKRAKVSSIGESYEKRELKTITITNGDGRDEKKVILIDAGYHGREWITPAAALYLIEQLVENYSENEELLADYDWVILPSVNPDGYTYSRTVNNMWRGTRQPPPSSLNCSKYGFTEYLGVDLNRNFNIHFLESGASATACGKVYAGPYPFSESETQAVHDLMHRLKDRAKMYISIHSFSQLILYPWGDSKTELPKNLNELKEIATIGVNSIKEHAGTAFTAQSIVDLYPAAGTSADYAYYIGIPISFVMELSPEKKNPIGFHPAESLIESYVKEAWLGISAMAQKVVERY